VDFNAILEKKKKAQESGNKSFQQAAKVKTTNNKMPMRKSGRGK